jgi:hypothetical protein
MLRRVALIVLTGSTLAGLSACGSLFDADEREPWRAEVEAACIASGQVRETAGIRFVEAVEGPGACGLDRPVRVSALEAGPPLGFASMSRPPDAVPLPPAPVGGSELQAGYADPGVYTPLPDLPALESSPPVRMRSSGPFEVSLDKSLVMSCSMVPATTRWLAGEVQPAALAAFGSPVVEMTSFGSYSCRRRNNARRGRLSEHAFANALDVRGFKLADGRETKVLTGWNGTPEERQFWRDVTYGACRSFTTVLGPGSSDGQHENHLHLDLARHSTARLLHVCRPRVPKGWMSTAERNGLAAQQPVFAGTVEEPLRGEDDQ